ncbi:hypothetical protein DSO57_1013750 [Entomophthora muscae]|uniref:Uncharacterized protein n=1 Tax=Entomophthora muscae TaxID=34485 RepID=A0ACC2RKD7_9FUNG|nr:hypothetical protein DSO57_1013750 [Entomophthora muscae]
MAKRDTRYRSGADYPQLLATGNDLSIGSVFNLTASSIGASTNKTISPNKTLPGPIDRSNKEKIRFTRTQPKAKNSLKAPENDILTLKPGDILFNSIPKETETNSPAKVLPSTPEETHPFISQPPDISAQFVKDHLVSSFDKNINDISPAKSLQTKDSVVEKTKRKVPLKKRASKASSEVPAEPNNVPKKPASKAPTSRTIEKPAAKSNETSPNFDLDLSLLFEDPAFPTPTKVSTAVSEKPTLIAKPRGRPTTKKKDDSLLVEEVPATTVNAIAKHNGEVPVTKDDPLQVEEIQTKKADDISKPKLRAATTKKDVSLQLEEVPVIKANVVAKSNGKVPVTKDDPLQVEEIQTKKADNIAKPKAKTATKKKGGSLQLEGVPAKKANAVAKPNRKATANKDDPLQLEKIQTKKADDIAKPRAKTATKKQDASFLLEENYANVPRPPKKVVGDLGRRKPRDPLPKSQETSQDISHKTVIKVPIKLAEPSQILEEDLSFTQTPIPLNLSRLNRVKTIPVSFSKASRSVASPVLEETDMFSLRNSPVNTNGARHNSPAPTKASGKKLLISKLNASSNDEPLSAVDFVNNELLQELKSASSPDPTLQKITDELCHQLEVSLRGLDQNHKDRARVAKELAFIRKRQNEVRTQLLLERQERLAKESALKEKTTLLQELIHKKKKADDLESFINNLKLLRHDAPEPKRSKNTPHPESFTLFELKAKLAIAQARAGVPLTTHSGSLHESIAQITQELEHLEAQGSGML